MGQVMDQASLLRLLQEQGLGQESGLWDTPRPQAQPMLPQGGTGVDIARALQAALQQMPPTRGRQGAGNALLRGAASGFSAATLGREGARQETNEARTKENEKAEASWQAGAREMSRRRWELTRERMKPQGAVPVGSQTYRVTPAEAKALKRDDWADQDIPLAQVEQARRLNTQPVSAVTGVTFDKKVAQAKEIARRVKIGLTDPRMTGFRDMKPYVEAELGDFDTASATLAYESTLTFMKQRETRLTQQQRNSMRAVQKQFALLEQLNTEYSDAASGLRTAMGKPNASVLWMAENGFLGKAAEVRSRTLKGQIVLMADQIANIFMAGGVPTEMALKMAQDVLHAEWSEDQIVSNSAMVKSDIAGRLSALAEGRPLTEGPYFDKASGQDGDRAKRAEKEFTW